MAASVTLGAVVELAAAHHGAFTRRQAAATGLSPTSIAALVRRGVLAEPAPGLLVVRGSPSTFERHATAAALLVGDRGAVAGDASGWLHRVDGVERAPAVIEVVVAKGRRVAVGDLPVVVRACRAGIDPRDVVELGGVRTTGLARTICDLAADRDRRGIVRLVDDFERRGRSLRWLEVTARRLQAKGRSGPGAVLAEIGHRTERRRTGREGQVRGSWFQQMVAECLASPRIPGLVEEYEVRDADGRFIARCDLAVPAVRLAIEAHSRRHHTGSEREAYDERRDNRLAEFGWDVRYVGWADTTDTPQAVRRYVERLVARRATDLGVPLLPPPAASGRSLS